MFIKPPFTAIAIILAVPLISILVGAGVLEAGDDLPKWKLPALDRTQREAIIADANKALNKHLRMDRKKETADDIDPAFWGTAISTLKPIRMRNDRVNVAIVLSAKDGVE